VGEEEIQKQVSEYLAENFLFGEEGAVIGGDDSFLEIGLIDSTGILELIQFLEESFGIEIDDEEIIPENLDSIKRVTRYVGSKRKG
jgi:acyl carrier protein